jgi:hypothetical protein
MQRIVRSLLLLPIPLVACSQGEPAPDFASMLPPPDWTPSRAVFDVTWRDSTVRIGASEARRSLEAIPPEDGVFRFRPPLPPQASQIEVGKHLLLEGIGLFKVTEVTPGAQGELAVRTEPGSLLEAASSGKIDVDMNVSLDGGVDGVGFTGVVPQTLPEGWAAQTPGPASYEFSKGPFKLKYSATPKDSGYEVNFEGARDPDANGGTVKFSTTAILRNPRAIVTVQWANDQITSPGLVAIKGSIAGKAKVDVAALSGGIKLKVPVKYAIPFSVGPVPMFIMLQPSVELSTTIQRKDDSASSEVTYFWSGETGFKVEPGGSWVPGVNNRDGTSNGGGAATTTTVPNAAYTYGIGVVAELRADLGMGVLLPPKPIDFDRPPALPEPPDAVARASVYAKFKGEAVSNFTVRSGQNARNCLSTDSNAGLYVGGELKLFTVTLQQEKQAWGVTKNRRQPTGCN